MRSPASSSVTADQAAINSSAFTVDRHCAVPQRNEWRPLFDIVFDWAVVCVATWGALRTDGWILLLAIIVIGNRQRALGNLLHDAAHQNLSAQRNINDRIARILLAPPLLNNLALYRQQHARHHAWLGDPTNDPDYIRNVTREGDRWIHAYVRALITPTAWASSILGHILAKRLGLRQRLAIFLWWATCEALFAAIFGLHFALLFFLLWMTARGTTFHAITTFREMTDHYGLTSGGIFSYTRDIPDRRFASILLHPHHNGYHLTHHLLPHVPYYQLPRVHVRLKAIPSFARHAIICDAYLRGTPSAVDGWGARHD